MATGNKWNIDRLEGLTLKAYLALGAFVCIFTGILAFLGKAPSTVDNSLFAVLLYLAGGFNFALAWRRWADGTGRLRAAQAYFATFIPFLAAGLAVGSPAGDTRVVLTLNIMLLAAFLIHGQKEPLKTS
jgi:hypothetical protein